MSRFPPIPPRLQTPAEQEKHEVMDALRKKIGSSYISMNNDGALIGPFASLLYAPSTISSSWLSLASAFAENTDFSVRARELAILATSSVYRAAYITYAHTRISTAAGLTNDQIQDALKGKMPHALDEEEQAIFEFALQVARTKGPLEESVWTMGSTRLGRDRVAILIHFIGFYVYANILLNAGDVPAPESVGSG